MTDRLTEIREREKRARATLEHIAKGRCSNPRQCAQECLDGDTDPDYFREVADEEAKG